MCLAVMFWPWMVHDVILPLVPQKGKDANVTANHEVLFLIMMLVLIFYGTVTHFLGSHRWGCLIAGMSFACIDAGRPKEQHLELHHVWVRQTKRYTSWMVRIFFSCTVAFSIPVHELLSF